MKPKKSILSRYAKAQIDSKLYGGIDVANSGDSSSITITDENGYIWAPYIPVMTGTIIDEGFSWEPTPEEVRTERLKKIKRIFNE